MRIGGWPPAGSGAGLSLMLVIVVVCCAAWLMFFRPHHAGIDGLTVGSSALPTAQQAVWVDAKTETGEMTPVIPVQMTLADVPATAASETEPTAGLTIVTQSWRRGGLGSKALVTLTLRNGNDYAVKDIEIACAFARGDGRHMTERRRVIHDSLNGKSRKTYARMLVGFVNINAIKAKCSVVAAGRG